VLTAIRVLLFLVGIGALGFYAYVTFDARIYEAYENWAFEQRLNGVQPTVWAFLHDEAAQLFGGNEPTRQGKPESGGDAGAGQKSPSAPSTPPQPEPEQSAENHGTAPPAAEPREQTQKPPQPASLIGRIMIPRLNIRAVVQEGVDDKTLRRAVGHVPGTALPGEAGNVGLAAHRDTFFRPLRHVRKNDRITLETLDGDYDYVVDSIRIVTPKDVEVLAPSKNPVLTLVTCYPFYYVGHAPKRFIVRARRVDTKPPELPGS
jgi:sortase A